MSPEEDRTHDAVDSEPKHYQLSYSAPPPSHTHGDNAREVRERVGGGGSGERERERERWIN